MSNEILMPYRAEIDQARFVAPTVRNSVGAQPFGVAERGYRGYYRAVRELLLHDYHLGEGGRFKCLGNAEVVDNYGDPLAEYEALRRSAGVLDLSFRGRLCVLGVDRERFLNGQTTNNVKALKPGEGCYTAMVTARGRMESDAFLYRLDQEMLLDVEPGMAPVVAARFEKFIIADDVQVVDVALHYGLLSVQGPSAGAVLARLKLGNELPIRPFAVSRHQDAGLGEVYLINQPRTGGTGYDVFVPASALAGMAERLAEAARESSGRLCGWDALETARVEEGIPRFGADMDETTLAPEAGIEARAISYTKGCYVGQEVIARVRTYGRVARALRGLRLADGLVQLPVKGDKLSKDGKEVGYITSAVASPRMKANIALAYVRREVNAIGTDLALLSASGRSEAWIVPIPFVG